MTGPGGGDSGSRRPPHSSSASAGAQERSETGSGAQFAERGGRGISITMFGLILACFALPFATVSCAGQSEAVVSGFQLVTGVTVEGERASFGWAPRLALLSAVLGLVFAIFWYRGPILSAAFGISGALFLFATRSNLQAEVDATSGPVSIEFHNGYWSALFLFALAGVLGLVAVRARWRLRRR